MPPQPPELAPEALAEHQRRVLSRLAGFAELTEAEVSHLAGSAGPPRQLTRGAPIRSEDDASTSLHLLIDGWAASAIALPNGARHLAAVSLPGDLLGLPSLAVAQPLDTVIALSPVVICALPIEAIAAIFTGSPRLAAMLFLVSQEERVLTMERLALMGQVPALNRLAAFFVRIADRIAQLERTLPARFKMPLTQKDLGDLIGVSTVHVNALIKELRTTGIVTVADGEMRILDLARLMDLAGVAPWRRSAPQWLPASRGAG